MQETNNFKVLDKQPTEQDPCIVDNYPYGYTLRTKIRYWTETTKNGQRFISQTLNPKTNLWNKPKKSIYSQIILIGLNEQNHITYTCLSMYSLEEAIRFKEKYETFLDDYQKTELTNIIKMSEVYDKIEYKIKARRYRNILTGEISECINIMELNNYEEIDDNNEVITPIDPDKERQKQKELNIQINKAAVYNAAKETSLDAALKTFKRGG